VEFGTIQLSNRRLRGVSFRHFHEGEATRLAGVAIGDDAHSLDTAVSGESSLKVVLCCLITEVSDKNVGHSIFPLFRDLSLSDCSRTKLLEGGSSGRKALEGDTDACKDIFSVPDFPSVADRQISHYFGTKGARTAGSSTDVEIKWAENGS
jgi:hypothetical protein